MPGVYFPHGCPMDILFLVYLFFLFCSRADAFGQGESQNGMQ
jgi:hypothetical protein